MVIDSRGQRQTLRTLVHVYDRLALDALLQAKWTAFKAALRQGDIPQALTYISSRSRTRYQRIFQALAADLPAVDTILTTITLVEVRDTEAIYRMTRTDNGGTRSFELRFWVDADGLWRLGMF